MNRTEAIATLEFLLTCSYVDEFEPDEKEALKMSIQALRQLTSYEHTIVKLLMVENKEGGDMINISMKMMQNECRKHEICSKECAFYDPDTSNRCFLYANPCDWELSKISESFNNMIIKNEEDEKRERY